ncbi:hypothetical protein ABXT43_05695 [Candidatus Pelagibacter sp. Uisw_114]
MKVDTKQRLEQQKIQLKNYNQKNKFRFLFLPDDEDPDSYANKNGKANFIDFTKQAKISIHQFIFNHYKQQTDNNPSSMAIFEKKLRAIAATIKDDFIKKYVLEFFLEKISSLTPHSNIGKKQFYTKKIKSLQSTQKHFNESKLLSGVELKEFSLLYLIMNNLDLFQENIHMIENINLFSEENKLILDTLITKLKSGEKLTLDQVPIDPQLTEKIFKFASIKHILNNHQNDQNKMFELLEEVSRDLKNYDLEFRIEELESKFSKDLSESTFNEIRELKKQKNIN